MTAKYLLIIVSALLFGISIEKVSTTSTVRVHDRSVTIVTGGYEANCTERQASDQIGLALQQLSSGDYDRIPQARSTLLDYAHQSPRCRKEIVGALIQAMDKPNLDIERQTSDYYLWREGSKLLGELKAVEGLDLLIAHLDMTNGFHSASMVFQPAILGVREMGEAAVPKLGVALRQESKPGLRMAAVYCLTVIGGVTAMNILTQAKEVETNKCVVRFITVSLDTFGYRAKGRIAFDDGAPQANTDARRNWLTALECVD